MAKLGSYYGLCPLIDQRSLQGISADAIPGHVIVTLGKNIAIRYKLSDQKQVHSWRTKDKFTSPVIYDADEKKYFAVFNQTYVRVWEGNEEHLDKLKKYKFNKRIHTILNCGGKSFVIFENGGIIPLKTALDNRKNLSVDDVVDVNSEEIVDSIDIGVDKTAYLGLIVKSKTETIFIWSVFLDGATDQQHDRICLNRKNVDLTGYVLCEMHNKHINLFTLWSDAKLYSRRLPEQSVDKFPNPEQDSYGLLYSNIRSVSCKQFVTMTAIDNDYISMYGAEHNQEGATLIIYNTQFKVSQTKQAFKMFSNSRKMWRIENNLLLCVGQHLAVVPFYLNTEQLAALIGSHKIVPDEKDFDVVYDLKIGRWDVDDTTICLKSIPKGIKSDVVQLLEQGLSESVICDHLIPRYIESEDVDSLASCLDYFEDIPDSCIAKLIQFSISANRAIFKNTKIKDNLKIDTLQPAARCLLIDKILTLPSSDVLLLPHIRNDFDVNHAVLLLQYLCYLLSDDSYCPNKSDGVHFAQKLIEWGCILLDANYQKFLLTQDEKICEVLNEFRNLVQEQLDCINDLKDVFPILNEITKGKSLYKNNHAGSSRYSIEDVKLY